MKDLIAKLEAATGPSRELDARIYYSIKPALQRCGPLEEYLAQPVAMSSMTPLYTSSIDAALTLVPEGWCAGFEHAGKHDRNPNSEAWCWPYNSDFEPDWRNGDEGYRSNPDAKRAVGTAAIALCIAALRSRDGGRG